MQLNKNDNKDRQKWCLYHTCLGTQSSDCISYFCNRRNSIYGLKPFCGVFFPTVLQLSHFFFGTYMETNDNLIQKSVSLFWVFGRTPLGTKECLFQSLLISYQDALCMWFYLVFSSRYHLTSGYFRSSINTRQTASIKLKMRDLFKSQSLVSMGCSVALSKKKKINAKGGF